MGDIILTQKSFKEEYEASKALIEQHINGGQNTQQSSRKLSFLYQVSPNDLISS
jgi:hypothetical protein